MNSQGDGLLARPMSQRPSYPPSPSQNPKVFPITTYRVTSPLPPVPEEWPVPLNQPVCCAAAYYPGHLSSPVTSLSETSEILPLCLALRVPAGPRGIVTPLGLKASALQD